MKDKAEGDLRSRSLADRLAAAHERWAEQTPQWAQPERELSDLITAACEALVTGTAAPAMLNQCDGCLAGYPVGEDGLHREPSGRPFMACQRGRYVSEQPAAQRPPDPVSDSVPAKV